MNENISFPFIYPLKQSFELTLR